MGNILLVLSTAAQSPKAMDVALQKAKERGSKLIVLFVADVELPAAIFNRLEGSTMVAEAPGQAVQEALIEEYKRQGQEHLRLVENRARELGIAVETIFKMGVFADECVNIIRKYQVDTAVLTRTRRSQLSRFIFGSPIKKIQDNVACKFEIVDLD